MNTVEAGGRAFTVVSHAEHPELEAAAQGEDFLWQWPQFMFHDAVAEEHYPTMLGRYPDFQFYIQDDAEPLSLPATAFRSPGMEHWMTCRPDGTTDSLAAHWAFSAALSPTRSDVMLG